MVVGASAPTLRDVHMTPVDEEPMAGAEVQANAIWTALHGAPLHQLPPLAALFVVALLAIVAPLVGMRFPALAAGLAVPIAGALFLVGAQLAFDAGLLIDVVAPLSALVVGGAGTIAWSQLAESRARRAVTRDNELLEERVRERTKELWETQIEVVQRLGVAMDWRDAETGLHIERIGCFCERLGLAVGMKPAEAELLRHASALHDVGKVGIPDEILSKPGPLSAEEWETMKAHTTIGGNILAGSASALVQLSETIALTHHEHWDGNGYPLGLRGEQIPLPGRICAVCDFFDALLSARPYKEPWPFARAIAEIELLSGSQFDPKLVRAFLEIAPGPARRMVRADRRGPAPAERLLGGLDGDPAQHVRHAVAGVDALFDPLEDVLPADHHHRVDPALEEGGEALAQQAVALVLEPLDLDQVGGGLAQVAERAERGRHLAAGGGERVGQGDRLIHRRVDAIQPEEVRGLLGVVDHVVQPGGEGEHVTALEGRRGARMQVVVDVVGDRVVLVLEVHELDPLLAAVRPGAHQLAQQRSGQLDVAAGLGEHPVELGVVRRSTDQLGERACHTAKLVSKVPAHVTNW